MFDDSTPARPWRIDARTIGWRPKDEGVPFEGLSIDPSDGALVLSSLPGPAIGLSDDWTNPDDVVAFDRRLASEITSPVALACDGQGGLVVVDAARSRLVLVRVTGCDPSTTQVGSVRPLATVGGPGAGPRQLRSPRGVAVRPDGGLVVADTGNHRVVAYTPEPYLGLIGVWGAVDAMGRPVPGDAPGAFRGPTGLSVASDGRLYVADTGNARIQVLAPDGEVECVIGAGVLGRPRSIAVGNGGWLAVVDDAPTSGGLPSVALFLGSELVELLHLLDPGDKTPDPSAVSVAFGPDGVLYVGDAVGVVRVFELSPAPTGPKWPKRGDSPTAGAGPVLALAHDGDSSLATVLLEDDLTAWSLRKLRTDGAYVRLGRTTLKAIDGGLDDATWSRIALACAIPAGSSVTVRVLASNTPTPPDDGDTRWTTWDATKDANADFLIPARLTTTGRYLSIGLILQGDGASGPRLASVTIEGVRESLATRLPAVFREDPSGRDFLERFVGVFQAEFDAINRRISSLADEFDPRTADVSMLMRLAAWVALPVNPDWVPGGADRDAPTLRVRLREAFRNHQRRGTAGGLEDAVRHEAQVEARVLEHYRLRRWPALRQAESFGGANLGVARLWSSAFYRRLRLAGETTLGEARLLDAPEPAIEPLDWGASTFSVFFPAHPYRVDRVREAVGAVIEREKPAYTAATLAPVLPRMRVGVQASVGVDSAVAGVVPGVLNRVSTLNFDAVLSGSPGTQAAHRCAPVVGVGFILS